MTVPTAVDFPVPTDLEGFWQFDRVHCPRPLTPLSQEVLLGALSEGFTAAMAEFAYPFAIPMRVVNSYGYIAFVPFALGDETFDERMAGHQERLAPVLPRIGELRETEWLPAMLPGLERARSLDYGALTDATLLATFAELRRDLVARWHTHGRIVFSYITASELDDFYQEHLAPDDPTEPFLLLHGFPTRSFDAQVGLWRLSRMVRASPALTRLVTDTPPGELPARLAITSEGRTFRAALAAYLDEFGWRRDGMLELSEPTWRDDPRGALGAIQGYLAVDDDSGPEERLRAAASLREQLHARARARLAPHPELGARFDELYARARPYTLIDEDHNFYIDQMGNAVMRLPVLEIGRRLAARGALAAPDDVFMLFTDELPHGLGGVDLRGRVTERQDQLAHWATIAPPLTLGDSPEDGPIDPFLAACIKVDGTPPLAESTAALLRGTPAAPGVARGRARVARSLEEAWAVEPGEVLVCEMTLPPWTPVFSVACAVVADTGGILSHCAIVAREYGIPCVVGTVTGTAVITTGQELTVDGGTGTVRIETLA
jgi:pyruvate,water dikinase